VLTVPHSREVVAIMSFGRPVLMLLTLVFLGISPVIAFRLGAQDSVFVDPGRFGFKLPRGEVKWSDKKVNALVKTSTGHTVARVHVKVGENFIVILPDGRLQPKTAAEIKFTDAPVVWNTGEELAQLVTKGPLSKFKTIQRRHHVFVYNTSEKMAEVTMNVMESMTRGLVTYMKPFGIPVELPKVPLVVVMFQTEAQFQAYRKMPPGVVAYYDVITNRVFLYEESPLLKLDRDLAIRSTLSTIAHEGAHQILANIGVQNRLSGWPMWISEGLAEYLAPTSVTRTMKWKGAGQINDFRMLELETFLRTKELDGIDGSVLKDTVAAARLTSRGYASAWSLTNYLAKREKNAFRDYLNSVSKLRPFEGSFPNSPRQAKIDKNLSQFKEFFGEKWEEIETEMIKYLGRQKFESPFNNFVHYAVLVAIPNGSKVEKKSAVFHMEDLARQWAAEVLRKNESTTRPTIKIIKCVDRPQAILETKFFYGSRR
jgi:hypothetical protein